MNKKKTYRKIPSSLRKLFIFAAFLTGSLFLFLSTTYRTSLPIPFLEKEVKNHDVSLANPIDVCFTPNKKCQTKILDALNSAKVSIYVQAYAITDPEILITLKEAASRGVDVKLLVDKGVFKGKKTQLETIGHPYETRIDRVAGLSHNKVMIIDSIKTIGGSYNYSKGAYAKNAENILFIGCIATTEKYKQNFLTRWQKARSFSPKAQ